MTRLELIGEQHANDVMGVCANLREMDHREIFATRRNNDPVALAADVMDAKGFSWIAYVDDVPTAVIGVTAIWPGNVTVYAFGTENWNRAIISLTRHATRFMLPTMAETGVRLAHVYVLSAYQQARGWLRLMGFVEEAGIAGFGKGGEDFTLMTWRPQWAS